MIPAVLPSEVSAAAFLLDVRELDEWEAGHIPGSLHLPMYEVPGRLDEIPEGVEVVVVCRVGARSAQVAGYLLAQGYDRAVNLAGGILSWQAAGQPLESADSRRSPRVI